MMELINVRPYQLARSFKTIEAAVAHAMSHPRLPEARRDAVRLDGAIFVDACWTLFEWIIRFDCDLSVHVWIEEPEIRWVLKPSGEVVIGDEFQRVGSPPVILNWTTIGSCGLDCSSLIAQRRGARFKNLFYSEFGLFIYLDDYRILHLGPAERIADGRGIIYAVEDD